MKAGAYAEHLAFKSGFQWGIDDPLGGPTGIEID